MTLAKNQLPIIQALTNKRKVALSLGDLRDPDTINFSDVESWLNAPDSILDRELTEKLIDGFGAELVCGFLAENETHKKFNVMRIAILCSDPNHPVNDYLDPLDYKSC